MNLDEIIIPADATNSELAAIAVLLLDEVIATRKRLADFEQSLRDISVVEKKVETSISRIFPYDANQWRKLNDKYWMPPAGYKTPEGIPMAGMVPVSEVPSEVLNGTFVETETEEIDEVEEVIEEAETTENTDEA